MPTVSIIVPNYNHAQYLKQRIDSILNQTYQDFELILLDDCSTDNSKDILNEYANHSKVSHIVFNEQNSGSPFKQWNKGVKLAKGIYVWIAESDDWAEPGFLKTMILEIKKHPTVGLVYSLARYQLDNIEPWAVKVDNTIKFFSGKQFIRDNLLYVNVIYNVSMTVFKRIDFLRINHSLYENMQLCGDWCFYVLMCQNADVLAINKILSNYRIHDSNTSSKEEKEGKSLLEGIEVLNCIIQFDKQIKRKDYSFFWAKQWVKYEKQFDFSRQTNRSILKKMYPIYISTIFLYYIYRIYYPIKQKLIRCL